MRNKGRASLEWWLLPPNCSNTFRRRCLHFPAAISFTPVSSIHPLCYKSAMAVPFIQIMYAEPELLRERTNIFNKLEAATLKQPRVISEVSPPIYREMREKGTN